MRVSGQINDFPLEIFPNWTILSKDRYYVRAPIERLGKWTYHLRTHITSLILAGNPAISFLQSLNSPSLTKLALAFSWLGFEEFFFSLIVSITWLLDSKLGHLLAILLSLGFFVASSLKVALCLPRPPSPPALPLSEENHDWAWPSNHALLGTAFPWFIWMYLSKQYDMPIWAQLFLLVATFTWNCGVSISRIYLGVHSPCDVLGGWTIGVLIMFIFGGFSDKLWEAYHFANSHDDSTFFVYFYSVVLFAFWIHPRAWPETQSFAEVVCVLSGTAAIWCGRYLQLGGSEVPKSLLEISPEAPLSIYLARFILGVLAILVVRSIVKLSCKLILTVVYDLLGLSYYSYSAMTKSVGDMIPTKRYTSQLRFKPVPGQKMPQMEGVPYDIDLPVKFAVYSMVGFMVAEGCPALFKYCEI